MDEKLPAHVGIKKYRIAIYAMLLMFAGFVLVGWKSDLKEVYSTLCFFLMTGAGIFSGSDVWQSIKQPNRKSQ